MTLIIATTISMKVIRKNYIDNQEINAKNCIEAFTKKYNELYKIQKDTFENKNMCEKFERNVFEIRYLLKQEENDRSNRSNPFE